MAKGFYIETAAIAPLLRRLQSLGPQTEKIAEMEVAAAAVNIERMAAQWAPVDNGILKNSIVAEKRFSMQWQVTVQAHYGAYVEFGTGTMVEVPKGLENYAKQFMAPRPVKREVNLPARPFFFPAYRAEIPALNKRLREELIKALKK
jgi:HK97 gp10 family phage protein